MINIIKLIIFGALLILQCYKCITTIKGVPTPVWVEVVINILNILTTVFDKTDCIIFLINMFVKDKT